MALRRGFLDKAAVPCIVAALVAGCNRSGSTPALPPSAVPAGAFGHRDRMPPQRHAGPVGQVHLAGRQEPLWFASVRDTLAFLRRPEASRDIAAIYVSDMAHAVHRDQPRAGAWVDPRRARFVIGSDLRTGFGKAEVVPFSDWALAESFAAAHGGRVVRLAGIPDGHLLGPADGPGSGAWRPAR